MTIIKDIQLEGSNGKPILVDIFYNDRALAKPVVIYAHGFNGFKDWGNFDIIAKQFAEAGFIFIKFNFSHNGTTPKQPEDFADLDAYGNNNYTKELNDLTAVINWTVSANKGITRIFLLGHSRGGGIVLLKAAEDKRIGGVVTWASVSECKTPWGNWSPEKMEDWKMTGVAYYVNSRTQQQMPLYYQLYEDYAANIEGLNIETAIKSLKIPVLLCHGSNDPAVPVQKARDLHSWQPASELFVVDSDHVFGRKHPWTEAHLPEPMQLVIYKTIQFFNDVAGSNRLSFFI